MAPKIQFKEFRQYNDPDDPGGTVITLSGLVDGKPKKWTAQGQHLYDVIVDFYFFYTGNIAYPPTPPHYDDGFKFTNQPANPEDFKHIEKVPPWA